MSTYQAISSEKFTDNSYRLVIISKA